MGIIQFTSFMWSEEGMWISGFGIEEFNSNLKIVLPLDWLLYVILQEFNKPLLNVFKWHANDYDMI